jgi:hypothetical protein
MSTDMTAHCTLCDEPASLGEELCVGCLSDPMQCEEYARILSAARQLRAIAARYVAARDAVHLARTYRVEGGRGDARARACIEDVARLRGEIRGLRAAMEADAPPSVPGLKKARERESVPIERVRAG